MMVYVIHTYMLVIHRVSNLRYQVKVIFRTICNSIHDNSILVVFQKVTTLSSDMTYFDHDFKLIH